MIVFLLGRRKFCHHEIFKAPWGIMATFFKAQFKVLLKFFYLIPTQTKPDPIKSGRIYVGGLRHKYPCLELL